MRAVMAVLLLALGFAGPVWSSPAAQPVHRIGVYPLERSGSARHAFRQVQADLKKSLALFPSVEVFDLAAPDRCRLSDLACLVNVGRLAAADWVVTGSVERFPNGVAVRLKLIDVARETQREVKTFLSGGASDLVGAMALAGCELLGVKKCEGTLAVSGTAGAQVLLGDQAVGKTPYSARLAIGHYRVRVAQDGLSTPEKAVDVGLARVTSVRVAKDGGRLLFAEDLPPPPLPPLPPLPPPAPKASGAPPAAKPLARAEPPAPPKAPVPAKPAATMSPSLLAKASAKAVPAEATTVEAPSANVKPVPSGPPESAAAASPIASSFVAVAPPGEPALASGWRARAFYASGIAGAVLVVTGVVVGALASSTAGHVNQLYSSNKLTTADKPLYGQVRTEATVANVAYGLGGVGLAGAAVLYFWQPKLFGGGGDGAPALSLAVGPGGVAAGGSF